MSGWKRVKGGNAGSKTQRRMERAPTPRQDAAVVYDDSLEGAARYAVAVLNAQVASQGRDWSPKLAHTACKKLEKALAAFDGRPTESAAALSNNERDTTVPDGAQSAAPPMREEMS